MPKSDKLRGSKQPPMHTIDAGKKYTDPLARSSNEIGMPNVPKIGNAPSISHSNNPTGKMNKRPPRRDPIPFD